MKWALEVPLVRPALRFIKPLRPVCLQRAPGGVAYLLTDRRPLVRPALRFIKPLRHSVYRELRGVCLIDHRRKPFSQTRPEVYKALAPLCLQRAPGGVAYCSQTEAL